MLLATTLNSETFSIILYSLAAVFQLIASIVALYQIRKFTAFSIGWIVLSLGLALMLTRRIGPLYKLHHFQEFSPVDAHLTFVVSILLLVGVLKLRKLFDHMQLQEQKLQQISKYDFLTGAFSRYAIIEQGLLEIERSRRLTKSFAILIIDVDKFKNINDTYGHVAGDYVLQEITNICKKSLRQIDMFARYGGDEFLAIFPDSDSEEIRKVASRLQSEIGESSFKFSNNDMKVFVSIGIGFFDPTKDIHLKSLKPKELLDHLIHLADKHMYQIKEVSRYGLYTNNFELVIS